MAQRRALLVGIDHYPHLEGRDLAGCRADVAALEAVLRDRYAFGDIVTLLDAAATRDAIVGELQNLAGRTLEGDEVMFFYAGHGSRVIDTDGGTVQCLVPSDSGRDPHPNRDLSAWRLFDLLQGIAERAAHVTLMLDASHSGTAPRSLATGHVRQVPADLRPTAAAEPAPTTRAFIGRARPSGWPAPDGVVVMAACRADELANEQKRSGSWVGAFSFGIVKALATMAFGSSWRHVLEGAAAIVKGRQAMQTPSLEGDDGRPALGGTERLPGVPVREVHKDRLVLGGGAAHGLRVGDTWRLSGQDVTITAVRATAAQASRPDKARVGDWVVPGPSAPEDALCVSVPKALHEAVDASPHLTREGDPAVTVTTARYGETRFDRPPEGSFVATGRDGRLAVRTTADPAALVASLEAVARYHNLLELQRPNSRLAGRVTLDIVRFGPVSGPADPDPGGLVLFEEGDRADFDISNHYDAKIYVSLVELGVDGAITLLLPDTSGAPESRVSVELAPGQTIRVGRDQYGFPEGLPLHLPEDFPWAAHPGESADTGLLTLKLLATVKPTAFVGLEQGATRSFLPGRHGPPDEWIALTRTVAVRRPRQGASLEGRPHDVSGFTVHAPGLEGRLTITVGDSGRTRGVNGEDPVLHDALEAAGLTTLATLTISEAARPLTRALAPEQQTIDVLVPALEAGVAVAGLYTDESGFSRWVFGTPGQQGRHTLRIAAPDVTPVESVRALQRPRGLKRAIKILTWRSVQGAVAAWERVARPYLVRWFAPDDFDRRRVPGLGRGDWQRLGQGPALLWLHGTFCHTPLAFATLGRPTVAALHAAYQGRCFAFDHPSLHHDPKENLDWFLSQVPRDVSLELDLVGHSRGGLLARTFAAHAERETGGRVRVRRVVCVATPNRGTALARTEHTSALLTAFTELANHETRQAAADLLGALFETLKAVGGDFVESLPGLRAMDPEGAFLRQLARAEAAGDTQIYAMTARFDAPRDGSGLDRFAQLLTTQFFGEDHDLVVPSDGVIEAAGSCFPIPAERRLDIDERGVWHNGFFQRDDVRQRLLHWLGVDG